MSMVHVYSLYSLYLARLLSGFPDSARFDLDVLKVRDCRNMSKHFRLQTLRFANLSQVDIDSYDGPMIEECISARLRPKVLQVEINAGIPPPLQYALLDSPHFVCIRNRVVDIRDMSKPFVFFPPLHSEMGGNWGMHIPLWNCLEFSRRSCLSTPPSLVYLSLTSSLGPDNLRISEFQHASFLWPQNLQDERKLLVGFSIPGASTGSTIHFDGHCKSRCYFLASCYGEDWLMYWMNAVFQFQLFVAFLPFFCGKPSMGLVICAYHFAAVGFCSSLKERLASLSGKACCSICSESNSCFFRPMSNHRKKMLFIRAQRGRDRK